MMEKKLPIGWIETGLLNIVEVCTGKKDANYATSDGKYLFFTCAYEPLRSDDYSFEGDVLILPGNGVNVGEVFYYSGKFEAYQRTYIVSNIKIDPKYLFYHFKRYWKEIGTAQQYGSATNYIKIGNFNDYRISFPPLPEQQRIVAKLNTLFGHIDALKTRLDRIPQLLKDFRQKVLTQAVTGKLTEEWREGRELEEWEEFTLEEYSEIIVDCPHSTPQWTESGKLCVRTTAFNPGFLDIKEANFVSIETYNERTQRLIPKSGDILYSREGTVGIACQIPPDVELCLGQRMILIRCESIVKSTYLMHVLNSPLVFGLVQSLIMGSTAPRINLKEIRKFIIPSPSCEEQQEIVRRVESLFAKADQIEASYQKLKAKIEQLPQALLAKAFRGELVGQLPTDGDARDLLEQIKRAKEGLERGGKGRKMRVEDEVNVAAEPKGRYGKVR